MRKITALVAHLKAATGLPRENFHAYADKGGLSPSGRHLGFDQADGDDQVVLAQIEIGTWKYDAVIQIERYAGDGPTLLAVVLGWIADNDPDRDGLLDPEVDAEINDNDTADIEISCEFEERLTLIEDLSGPIAFNGRRWRVDIPDIAAAASVSLEAGHAG